MAEGDRHHHSALIDRIQQASSAAADVMKDALASILTRPPQHEHWEEVLAEYDRTHRRAPADDPARGETTPS